MTYIALLAAGLVLSFIYNIIVSRKDIKQKRKQFEQSFGQPPTQKTDLESVRMFFELAAKDGEEAEVIDDITWNDLDMDQVFHRINTCKTSIGEEKLYYTLRSMKSIPADFDAYVSALRQNKEARIECQMALYQLGRMPYSGLLPVLKGITEIKTLPRWFIVAMSVMPLVALVSMIFIGYSGLLLLLGAIVFNMVYSALLKQKLDAQLSGMRYFSRMLNCTEKLSKIKVEGLNGLLAEIADGHRLLKPLKSRVSALTAEVVSNSQMGALDMFIRLFTLSDVRAYQKAVSVLNKHTERAFALYHAVGLLDMLIAVASFRKSLGAVCVPVFHETMEIKAERMGHPLLVRPVTNDCHIRRDTIITGSNASGKSTFIKALAVNALLAQAIHTCAAKSFALPRARIVSSMALRDDITKGDSYFIAEIKSFKRIMDLSEREPCLCFVDEILRGTNTIERIAASAAVLYSLSRAHCLCLVASHDIELTRILKNEYDNYHFSEQVTNAGVSFDYLLREGASKTRNAILLLSAMGFDPDAIDTANELVAAFESTNSWPPFTGKGKVNVGDAQ